MGNHLDDNNEIIGTKEFLLGAMIGGVIGAATALWLSPKSGTALRQSVLDQSTVLKEKASILQGRVSDIAQKTKEKTSSLTQTLTHQSSEAISKLRGKSGDNTGQLEGHDKDEDEDSPHEPNVKSDLASIQQMLAETKQAFDETEKKLSH